MSYANETCVVDCVIRNLSLTGASLAIPMTVGIPNSFTLVDAHGGTRHPARIVWRKGDRVGVRFLDIPDAPSVTGLPLAQRRLKPRRDIQRAGSV